MPLLGLRKLNTQLPHATTDAHTSGSNSALFALLVFLTQSMSAAVCYGCKPHTGWDMLVSEP